MCIGASPLMREQPRKKAEGIRGEGGWWGGGGPQGQEGAHVLAPGLC